MVLEAALGSVEDAISVCACTPSLLQHLWGPVECGDWENVQPLLERTSEKEILVLNYHRSCLEYYRDYRGPREDYSVKERQWYIEMGVKDRKCDCLRQQ